MTQHYVYKLTDLITEEYYIGVRSCQGPAEEDRAYRGSMKSWKLSKEQKLLLDKIIIKTFSTREEANEYESQLILQAKELKDPMNRNGYIPGKGFSSYGKKHSEESRKKIGEVSKGRAHTEESRKKLSEALKGENHYMYGKIISEETRKKISESQKGNQYKKGKTHTEEARKKMSEAKKGKTHTEETRKKIGEASKGRTYTHSEEARKKLSEAVKNYWKNKKLK